MKCSNCRFENGPERRFCGECGRALTVGCPVCGAANEPVKFCGACGSPLSAADGAPVERLPAQDTTPSPTTPESERRLVSVLFADLVGFTAPASTNVAYSRVILQHGLGMRVYFPRRAYRHGDDANERPENASVQAMAVHL